ncbi:MAG: hypothetical protein QNJ85_19350 [Gammaproteobacteria bacterium]|nr:hypothetical protein [Gammaproteobacteria bacterium]
MKPIQPSALGLALALLLPGITLAQEQEQSIDEIAKELANPNTSVASLTFKLQYRTFEGDLGDADDQDSTTLLFQPSLPFKRDDGSKIIWRPAVPLIVDQPLFEGGDDWDEETGMGAFPSTWPTRCRRTRTTRASWSRSASLRRCRPATTISASAKRPRSAPSSSTARSARR